MGIQNYISAFNDAGAYDASALNCHASRHDCDVGQGV